MNKLTRKIRDKGYSLEDFCAKHWISLRTYRRYEKTDNQFHDVLVEWVDKLGDK